MTEGQAWRAVRLMHERGLADRLGAPVLFIPETIPSQTTGKPMTNGLREWAIAFSPELEPYFLGFGEFDKWLVEKGGAVA